MKINIPAKFYYFMATRFLDQTFKLSKKQIFGHKLSYKKYQNFFPTWDTELILCSFQS
jgi:hypothetical protein